MLRAQKAVTGDVSFLSDPESGEPLLVTRGGRGSHEAGLISRFVVVHDG